MGGFLGAVVPQPDLKRGLAVRRRATRFDSLTTRSTSAMPTTSVVLRSLDFEGPLADGVGDHLVTADSPHAHLERKRHRLGAGVELIDRPVEFAGRFIVTAPPGGT